MLAVVTAISTVARADDLRGLAALAAAAGLAVVVVALLAAWDDGLAAGPALLVVAYALSLAGGSAGIDWNAPLVAGALLAVLELGSWSLELRDGAEERPLAHLRTVALPLVAALAASTLVLVIGSVRIHGGLWAWMLGAAAAIALFGLITRHVEDPPFKGTATGASGR